MIYLDNHATTQCDRRVVDAMLPWFSERFGNPHSISHAAGRIAADAIEKAIGEIASCLGVGPDSVVITSGATESNNLAIRGFCEHPRQKRKHIVTAATDHPAVLDVFSDLQRDGFRITKIPVIQQGQPNAGVIDLDRLVDAIDEDVALVSVMWANNEIGTIAPMNEIAEVCHKRGVLLHSDATQAVGRIATHARQTDVDLLSASAHKFYGPKGVGLLVVGNGNRRVRIKPQITGGGQQRNLRSGTMNPAGIIGMATALTIACDEMTDQTVRVRLMRDRLAKELLTRLVGSQLNGPNLDDDHRLPGNLNIQLPTIEGDAWISATPDVAFSSGSACSSVNPEPSHVLTAIGLDESQARQSVRFGVGRFNTDDEIARTSDLLCQSYAKIGGLAG